MASSRASRDARAEGWLAEGEALAAGALGNTEDWLAWIGPRDGEPGAELGTLETMGAPHSPQKRWPSGVSLPQLPQRMAVTGATSMARPSLSMKARSRASAKAPASRGRSSRDLASA